MSVLCLSDRFTTHIAPDGLRQVLVDVVAKWAVLDLWEQHTHAAERG